MQVIYINIGIQIHDLLSCIILAWPLTHRHKKQAVEGKNKNSYRHGQRNQGSPPPPPPPTTTPNNNFLELFLNVTGVHVMFFFFTGGGHCVLIGYMEVHHPKLPFIFAGPQVVTCSSASEVASQ